MILDFNRSKKEDPLQSFLDEIERSGLGRPPIQGTGEIERWNTPTCKGQDKAGWAILYLDNGFAAGAWGSWREGTSHSWASSRDPTSIQRMTEAKEKGEAERSRKHEEAMGKASIIWDKAQPASEDHPYLKTKGVKPYGIRQVGDRLVIPVRDQEGNIHSIQEIYPDGRKKNLSGGVIKGNFFIIPGRKPPFLVEGYATGATVHAATGSEVVVCLDCGNLKEVAMGFLGATIAADNDHQTQGNPGLTAARTTGLPFIYPDGIKGSDFNDLQNEKGLDTVRQILQPNQSKSR